MSEHKHLYNMAAWRRLRVAQLTAEPLCRMCRALGQLVEARVADHVTPHRGDVDLFLDASNLQSLCKRCHDSHKQAQERNGDGILRGAGHDGLPLDLAHPFHRPLKAANGLSGASSSQTFAILGDVVIASNRGCAAPARGLHAGVGGGQKSAAEPLKTACEPSFANCQNSVGGA